MTGPGEPAAGDVRAAAPAAGVATGGATGSSRRVGGTPLPARWATTWVQEPSRAVLRVGDGAWVSGGDLDARSRHAAGLLAAAGVRPGDRVLLVMPPTVELVAWHLGTLRLGAVSVPTNPAASERELAHVLRDSGPTVAVVAGGTSARQGTWVAGARPGCVVLDGTAEPGRTEPAADGLDAAAPTDPALLVYTSGTTGVPKGVVLTHANLAAGIDSLREAWAWGPDDRLASALPLFHVHGLAVAVHGALTTGGSLTLLPRFDPGALLARMRDDRASMLFGVPTMYHRMAAHPDIGALRALRLCVSGSAALSPVLWQAVRDATGQELLERYGMSETLLTLSNPLDGERRPGTVGRPLPGVQVRLAAPGDTDDRTDGGAAGRSDGAGSPALLQVRGPTVFAGYWQRPEATEAAFEPDGWFRTGDLAAVDPDGYVRIVGRDSDMIVSGGHNVYPQEVEEVILGVLGVREAAVVGVASEDLGEAVVAFVVADATTEQVAEQVAAHCTDQLSRYKVPRSVHLVTELPRNSMGKVLRAELRKDAAPG